MDFTLIRQPGSSMGIFGELEASEPDGLLLSTLEHAFMQPDGTFKPAVPAGVYTCKRRLSPRFGYDVFELLNVPGHDFIEIHKGNYNHQSDGCILLGMEQTATMITSSLEAFTRFMELQHGLDTFQLTILDAPA